MMLLLSLPFSLSSGRSALPFDLLFDLDSDLPLGASNSDSDSDSAFALPLPLLSGLSGGRSGRSPLDDLPLDSEGLGLPLGVSESESERPERKAASSSSCAGRFDLDVDGLP
eukprot:7929572-Pyramimonas_sp.AAC.1